MNHTYRLVWNTESQRYVPAPECARSRGKGSQGKARVKPLAMLLGVALAHAAFAAQPPAPTTLPTGGQVVAGQAGIAQSGSQMTVNQGSDKAIINWQSFNIGSQAGVTFVQPSTSAVALNRVIAGDASQIYGRLAANGQIWLINPNGVLFGAGSKVDVGGLVASTLATTNEDFLAGKAVFTRNDSTGSIVNQGEITAAEGGLIALLAPTVKNEGILRAQLGNVAMVAGEKITLASGADGRLNLAVTPATLKTLVENKQLIVADGGQVIMTAKAADALAGAVVANSGTVQAQTLAAHEGRILLLADMEHGEVKVGGTLDASAPASGNGGFIETSAAKVTQQTGRKVTTTAEYGKTGTWLIDPNDYTIAASGGDITGSQLSTDLASTNVVIQSSSGATAGNGDINVNDAVGWSSNTLTLTAARDININAVMTASGSSKLVMNTGTANGSDSAVADGNVKVGFAPGEANGFAGRVDFPGRSGTGFLTINGHDYTVINSLGAEGSTTGTDLQGMLGDMSGYYALGSNIDASSTNTWNSGTGFYPIGDTADYLGRTIFLGVFDGLGHVISGLTINRPERPYIGLFGRADNELRNVGLEEVNITGQFLVGGLVGNLESGSILNAYSKGVVSGGKVIGGLAGMVGSKTATISNSYANAYVVGEQGAGGLIGTLNYGSVTDSYALGEVSGNAVGGLVGFNYYGYTYNSYYNVDQVSLNGKHLLTRGGIFGDQYSAWQAGSRRALNPVDYLQIGGSGEFLLGNAQDVRNALPFVYAEANNFRLTADLDLTGHKGLYLPVIAGQLDGAAHVVRNIDLSDYGTIAKTGWVGELTGSLRNIGVENGQVSGYSDVGGLVGHNWGAITGSHAAVEVSAAGNAGGLVGYSYTTVDGQHTRISDSYATGNVTGKSSVGGLVGAQEDIGGSITNAYATGNVSGIHNLGGLVGHTYGSNIDGVYATGVVSGTGDNVGGLVGSNDWSAINNAYALGNVTGLSNVGGLIGRHYGEKTERASLANTHASGNVSGTEAVGGLIGCAMSGEIINSYSTGSVDGRLAVGGLLGFSDVRFVQTRNSYYNASQVRINSGQMLTLGGIFDQQYQAWHANGYNPLSPADYLSRNGQGEYLLGSVQDIRNALPFVYDSANNFRLTADIDLAGNPGLHLPILAGRFDGDSHVVHHLDLSAYQGVANIGWVGGLTGTLQNIGIDQGLVSGFGFVGGLVGYATGTISNAHYSGSVLGNGHVGGLVGYSENTVTINNAYSAGEVSGDTTLSGSVYREFSFVRSDLPAVGGIGGLAGYNFGNISNAYSSSEVRGVGDNVGGLVGYNFVGPSLWEYYGGGGSIQNAYATGNVSGSGSFVGGLLGFNGSGAIGSVYASGNVSGTADNVGGLIGSNSWGSITNAYATGSVSGRDYVGGLIGKYAEGIIENTYAAGQVTGRGNLGGLLGLADQSEWWGYVSNSFWDIQGTGQTTSAGGTGMTTAQMKVLANFTSATSANGNVDPGWNFTNTWRIYEGQSYPVLRVFQKDLTVTANNASKTYDGTAYSGGNGITQSTVGALSGTVSYSGNSQGATNAGSYAITPSVTMMQQDYQNWHVSYLDGTLTINPATLTITGGLTGTVQKTYDGTTAATLAASNFLLTGWVGSDGATVTKTTGTYDNANAGSGKTVTVSLANSDYAATGSTNLANYTLPTSISGNVGVIDKAALTVTASDASKTYGQTRTFTGSEFTSSGLQNGETIGNVNLASNGSAATANVAGGPYAITASNATGGTFNAGNYTITYANGSLTVTPAALTVTANDASKTYGQTKTFTGSEFTSSGLQNGETIGSVSLASSGSGATANVAGSPYAITASNATGGTFNAGNYTITYANGSLTVTPAALTVTANDASKTYGQTKTFTGSEFTSSGLQNGETIGSVSLASSGSGATANVAGSPYAITGSDATGGTFNAGNYTITYANGNLTVTPAALTITANDASKTFDGKAWNGGNGVSYAGFVAGQDASVLTGSLIFSGTSQGAIDAGTYTITPSGLLGDNYTITYADGSLIITPAPTVHTSPSSGEIWRSNQAHVQPQPPRRPADELQVEQQPNGNSLFLTVAPDFIRVANPD